MRGLELGPGGLGAADLEQELRQRQRRLRVAGAARRRGAQHRLGAVGVAGAQVPLHQRLAHAGVVGEELGHALRARRRLPAVSPSCSSAASRTRCRPWSPGVLRQRRVDQRQRLLRRAGVEPVGDQHHLRRDDAGVLGDHAARHLQRRGAGLGVAEVDRRLQRPDLRVGGRLDEGLGGMLLGGGEVLHLQRDLGDRALRLEVGRILVGHPQVLPHRLAGLAARRAATLA